MTTTVLFLIAVTCSLVAFYYQRRLRIIDELPRSAVLVNQIPGMGDSLRRSGREGSFAAFLCASPDRPGPDDVIEAQLSLEHGKLGFDWVLLAPRNIQERKRVEEFARTRGIQLIEKRRRGVDYLRTEDGDVARLCVDVITEIVGIENSAEIVMLHRGFDVS